MANSYNNIILHLVFAVKNRESLIAPKYFPEFQNILPDVSLIAAMIL